MSLRLKFFPALLSALALLPLNAADTKYLTANEYATEICFGRPAGTYRCLSSSHFVLCSGTPEGQISSNCLNYTTDEGPLEQICIPGISGVEDRLEIPQPGYRVVRTDLVPPADRSDIIDGPPTRIVDFGSTTLSYAAPATDATLTQISMTTTSSRAPIATPTVSSASAASVESAATTWAAVAAAIEKLNQYSAVSKRSASNTA